MTSIGSFAALLAVVETPVLSRFFGCRPLGPVGLAQAAAATAGAAGLGVATPRVLSWLGRNKAK
jgi:hypothetical protein